MTTKSPDPNEKGTIYASDEIAQQWHRGKAQRADATGRANNMMLDLANVRTGDRVLEVAAGTGDQTLLVARRVGATGCVLATDVSTSMLNLAAEAVRSAGLTNVDTRVMDAENIDLNADSFDAVICRMGLMLFPNPVKALIEMHRVVKPTGKVVALVLGTKEKNPYQGLPLAIVRRVEMMLPPTQRDPAAFSLGDPRVLEDVYRRAGFLDVAVHAVSITRHYQSSAEAIRAIKDFIPFFLQDLVAQLSDSERELAWAELERQIVQFQSPNGFEIPGEVLIGVGTK